MCVLHLLGSDRRPAGRSRRERELEDAPGKRTRPWEEGVWAFECGSWREAAAAAQAVAMEEAMGGAGGEEAED
nr:unnamed protein product [Digitaria exilis]